MPCYYPVQAYMSKNKNPETGKGIIQWQAGPTTDRSIQLPCGNCIGCRLERSRVWALRCMHEAQLHPHDTNHFITLTYDDEHLPLDNNLVPKHLSDYWKRLRKNIGKLRYYSCGEYGDKKGRPHYHAIVFGLPITDKKLHSTSHGGPLYTSKTLEENWGHGHVLIGDVTYESCAYVARYIMKKVNGKKKAMHYVEFEEETGLITREIVPEFTRMSNRSGGIGKGWYAKYKSDIYQEGTDGTCILRGGIKSKPPRYYEDMYYQENPEHLEQIKKRRTEKAVDRQHDNTKVRLRTKEQIKLQQFKKLERALHME